MQHSKTGPPTSAEGQLRPKGSVQLESASHLIAVIEDNWRHFGSVPLAAVVPYKGTAPALTDLLGGQVDMMFISLVTGAAQVHAGKLRGYGVTSAQRQPSFPDLPAIGEVVKGFESTAWFGVFAPARLSPALTDRLNAAIRAALDDPELHAQLESEGATPAGMSAADFAAFVRADVPRWAPVVRQSGARPD